MNKKKIIRIAAYFSAGLIVAFAVAATRGLFTAGEIPEIRKTASDGCFVASVCLIGFGLLLFAGNGGAFDMLAYGVKSVFSVFRNKISSRYGSGRRRKGDYRKQVHLFRHRIY